MKKKYISPKVEEIETPELMDWTGKWSGEEGNGEGAAKPNNGTWNWNDEEDGEEDDNSERFHHKTFWDD